MADEAKVIQQAVNVLKEPLPQTKVIQQTVNVLKEPLPQAKVIQLLVNVVSMEAGPGTEPGSSAAMMFLGL